MAQQKPRILSRHTVAQTRIFRIEEMALEFANGAEARYERLVGSAQGAVLVVPLMDPDTVLLIREYAAGEDRYELGLPKGKVEPGEELLVAANREIMEEIGFGAHRLDHLTDLTLAPGYVSHTTHVVLAQDLYPERRPGDEPEEIEVVPWRLSRLNQLLAEPDCTEARSIAALFIARESLGGRL